MNTAALYKAGVDRVQADTGIGGLYEPGEGTLILNGGVTGLFGPPTGMTTQQRYPYLVVVPRIDGPEDGFDFAGLRYFLDFHVYDKVTNGIDNCSEILDRLRGNWDGDSPGTAPTYGFYRHRLDLATAGSSWTAHPMTYVGGDMVQDDVNILHFLDTYAFTQFRK